MSRRNCLFPLLSIAALFASRALFAQTPTFAEAPFSATVAELRAASAAAPVDHDYEVQVLLEEGVFRTAADGTLFYQHRMIYRLDSAEGVKDWAEISSGWDPWYEKMAGLHARVLRPDGDFIELDQKTVTDAPVSAEDNETFSSSRVRRAPLPGLAIGSIVEETETVEEKTPYFAGGSVNRFGFHPNVPTLRERVIVELPASFPYKDKLRNLPGVAIARSEKDGVRRTVYEETNLKASHGSDIDLSTDDPASPVVEFATGASWGAIATSYAALADPQTVAAEAAPLLPEDLPAERMARIRAIVQRLHREIRYTGVEFGAAKLTPMRPSEVIKRHYGDCKDKATLLVAMLRSAGIPANLALLSTGPGRDLDQELPGMNLFDHAIVYVPAGSGKGEEALWIDATAQYNTVGSLPYPDTGRMALIVAPTTTALTRTTMPSADQSVLKETRTFTLAQLGPSHVVEDSDTFGSIDAFYRSDYGGTDTKKIREGLEEYVQTAYLAKKLTSVTHGDGSDLEHPFHLTIVADGARRGYTSMNEAIVAVFPNGTVNGLPKWFSVAPPVIGPDTSPTARAEQELAEKSRQATYSFRPFITEQHVRILIPDGFTPRSLPPSKTTQLGAATLTETYSDREPGVVTADLRFDSGLSTITAEQALAMRAAVLELNKRDYVAIYFDQIGAKAMAAGHIREALEADHALIQAHPAEALHHARLARALLEAGIGDEAHVEARRATELDPKSAVAFSALGWVLQHNSLGERFGKNYDRAGAIAAYRKAIALDPDDNDPPYDLAILLEFDARGVRYSSDADMPEAIKLYRSLVEKTREKDPQSAASYRENLLYSLLYSRQFAELDKMIAALPSTNTHTVFAITSAAAQHGAPAGIAQAGQGNAGASDRNKNLRTAATQLAMLHLYAQAAEVLSAGLQGDNDAATAARQIELYKNLHETSLKPLPATNPARPVQAMLFGLLAGTLTREQAAGALSHQAYASDAAFDLDVKKNLASSGVLRVIASRSDMTESVLMDLVAGNSTFTTAGGDDAIGYAIVTQTPGAAPLHHYVVKDDGAYRIIGDENDSAQIGNAVLYALQHGKPAEAKAMLDWKRDLTHRAGGDDSFAGPLLPRFWTVGSSKEGADSPAAMRIAALSLMAGSMDAKPYLAEIGDAQAKASGSRQTDLDLLLACAADGAEEPAIALPAAKRLMEQDPDSFTAVNLAGRAYSLQGQPEPWRTLLTSKLAKHPTDRDLLSEQIGVFALAHDFAGAQTASQKVLDSGKAVANDYNQFAWLGLFHDYLGDDVTKAAQQSNMLTHNGSFGELHTLACIYAAQGKTTEAREVLKQALVASSQPEPNSEVWYALGLIYEQYGAKTAALEAYNRVYAHEFDDHTYIGPTSTYVLAQARIKSLGGAGK
ncbi:Transglutaminase-like superfamily protein [Granulicella rosea]|uniref:Transglutaminase-like superfamily protein n=1 Tax=Granulicella rosea TaxID=474952 RepID=A0A239HYA5_9BACT|nr:DUF3857 and transglutaminase domain-containing protein [Granulicella rosea]SNS85693.1 Transglutaminase-like superfamily protein [Granulicella rosea]